MASDQQLAQKSIEAFQLWLACSHSNGVFVFGEQRTCHSTGVLIMEHVVTKRLLRLRAISEWGIGEI
jgi:hypothetical protein